ncbi:MAG: DUF6817 domain-containing protein [Opitutaceae bacterium]
MIAQTNLQLYNQLIAAQWSEEHLQLIKQSLEVAKQLFADQFRPSGKPFLSHLIGTASALAYWRKSPEIVAGGLLHSLYLYGNFGDREHGVTEARRTYIRNLLGNEVESYVYAYTTNKGKEAFESDNEVIVWIQLADLYDELGDLGPAYAVAKPLRELQELSEKRINEIHVIASKHINDEVAQEFDVLLHAVMAATIPTVLTTSEIASYRSKSGIDSFKSKKSKTSKLRKLFKR